MVESDLTNQFANRDVYEEFKILEIQQRVVSLDGFDNVAVFFDESGKLMPYELQFVSNKNKGQKSLPPQFELLISREKIEKLKRGQKDSSIHIVKYLPRAHLLALLDDNSFQILSRELNPIQEIQLKNKKDKVTSFCLNMAVYRASVGNSSQSQTDQICVSTKDNFLYFYETVMTQSGIQFQLNPKEQFEIRSQPNQLHWDDDKIFICTSKGYQILSRRAGGDFIARIDVASKSTGIGSNIAAKLDLNRFETIMAVNKSKCLVVTNQNKRAQFLEEGVSFNRQKSAESANDQIGVLMEKPSFLIDQTKNLVQLALVETDYVVAVYDTQVTIFNQATGDIIQELVKLDKGGNVTKFRLKNCSINIENKQIYLVAHNIKKSDKELQTEIYFLREIPVEEQIQRLLFECRIDEARDLFNSRGNKSADVYSNQLQRFNLDAAWQLLQVKMDVEKFKQMFQLTAVDPRELILLNKDLYDTSAKLKNVCLSVPDHTLRHIASSVASRSGSTPDVQKKTREAQDAIRSLLEIFNSKYVAELRKDPNKEVEFMVSTFSQVAPKIRQEKQKLKDIVSHIQTAIVKMYIDADNNGDMEMKVYDFFNNMITHSTQGVSSTILQQTDSRAKLFYIEASEMNDFLRRPDCANKKITKMTLALLNELQEKSDTLETALILWFEIKDTNNKRIEQASERTVAILKTLGKKDLVEKYIKWVFETKPETGLKIFTEGRNKSSESSDFRLNPQLSMSVEECLNFLAEVQRLPGQSRKQDEKLKLTFEQQYLQAVCEIQNAPEQYFTQFASSVVNSLYAVHPRTNQKWDGSQKDVSEKRVQSIKQVLYQFLNNPKSNYNPDVLKKQIGTETWLTDEYILVLVKAGKPKEAIDLYVKLEQYDKAAQFGEQQHQLTELLTTYLEQHQKHIDTQRREKFRALAIKLMQSKEARNQLKPLEVLQMIPGDWPLKSSDCDLIGFLSSIFDHQLTVEENSKIEYNLTKMEEFNTELEHNELQSAYLIIREETDCKVCHTKLGHKKIRIYPHGMAFHMRCAKNPSECPITKQRFDIDAILSSNMNDLGDL